MRKPAFCICENKDTDQLCGNRAADQRLYFLFLVQSLYFLNPKFQAPSHHLWLYSPVCVGSGQKTCFLETQLIFEPRSEKTGLRGFRPGLTQTGLYSHRRWLEACNFRFR